MAWTKNKTRTKQGGVREWSIFAQSTGTWGRDTKQGNLQNNPPNIYRSREGDHLRLAPEQQELASTPFLLVFSLLWPGWQAGAGDQGIGAVEREDHHPARKKRKRAFSWCHTPAAKWLTIGPCLGVGVGWGRGQGLAITPIYYWENNQTWQRN